MRRSVVLTVAAGLAVVSTGAMLLSDHWHVPSSPGAAALAETPRQLVPEPNARPLMSPSRYQGEIQLTGGEAPAEPGKLNPGQSHPITAAPSPSPSSYTQLTAAEGEQPKSSRRYVPSTTPTPRPSAEPTPARSPAQSSVQSPTGTPTSGLPSSVEEAMARLKSGGAATPSTQPQTPSAGSPTTAAQTPIPANPTTTPDRFGPSQWQAVGGRGEAPSTEAPTTEVPQTARRIERETLSPSNSSPAANGPARLSSDPSPTPPAGIDSESIDEPSDSPAATSNTSPYSSGSAYSGSRRFSPTASSPEPAQATTQQAQVSSGSQDNSPQAAAIPSERLFSVSSPTVTIETVGPKSIVLGKPTPYRVIAKNAGSSDARQISVHLIVPDNVQIAGAKASVGRAEENSADEPIVWQIPVLPGKSEAELELQVIAQTSRHFELGANVIYSEMLSTASIAVLEPKLALAIEGPQDMRYGETSLFKLVATNTGTGPAEKVAITILPMKEGQQPTTIDTLGTIAAGQKKVIELELTAKQAGTLKIDAHTQADGDLRAEAAHQVMVRRAQLQLAATGPVIRYAATEATYQLTLTNRGNAEARDVVIQAQLPEGAQFVRASQGGRLDETNRRIVWQLDQLDVAADLQLEATCVLESEGENLLVAKALSAGESELTDRVTTRVESVADLKLFVSDPKGPVPVGDEVTYEFKLVNRGTKAAQGVKISVQFADSVQPTGVSGGQGQINQSQVDFDPIPQLAAGEERVVTVKAQANREGNHVFRTEVVCNDTDIKLAAEETTRFYGNASTTPSRAQATPNSAFEARQPTQPSPATPPTSRFR